ncbi:MAG TPA: polymer-forming cytoskeletal protein [Anaeromyxobacter sp.]|nr:polymer-forming cytoskeletal protein [Anaeromyxobacter sp.]
MSMIKRDDVPATPSPGASGMPGPGGTSDLLLGAGAEFEGKLTFRGTVRIDALFKGSIVTNDVLVVGEHARIDAEITCGTVVVLGEVNGDIRAKTAVEVQRTGKVRGNVESPSIAIEKGALLHGSVKMTPGEKPGSVKPVPAAPVK